MAIHLLGIRHHGPGSARNVRSYLEKLKPDIVLVEGPVEANNMLEWVSHEALKPPVAILCYQPDQPQESSFYPFAEFSPEWQAIIYARQAAIPVQFMDLPVANRLALEKEPPVAAAEPAIDEAPEETVATAPVIRSNPIEYLASAAGYEDSEKWWEHMFEYRQNDEAVFEAVQEAMQELRTHFPEPDNYVEKLREAYMRKLIRQAEKEMYTEIAVVCGAWHVPALAQMPKQKEDNDLLKGLPKVKIECTWIPWTFDRLSLYSGYGAGIRSPGWYAHTWQYPQDDGTRWMALVAKLFRARQMDTSVAHVMEAVRLANSLAALRNLSRPGLEELNEATLSILCYGESIQMQLIQGELIVSNRLGEVPEETPKPPLQLDIEKQQKKLRLPATADWKDYTLDLRKETDLQRSILLHRLRLLQIHWGTPAASSGKGTFKEQWRVQWDPAFSIAVIDKGSWGNTIKEATARYVIHLASEVNTLPAVCGLLEDSIPAEIPTAIEVLIQHINNLAAASGDVPELMGALPGLVNISRYGNVRQTDVTLVLQIVESMAARICIGLPGAATGIDEDAATLLLNLLGKVNEAVNLLQQESMTTNWQQTLQVLAQRAHTSPVIGGYATRLLSDRKLLTGQELVKAFYYAMSTASAPPVAAAWLEGFLKGSGTLLLLDDDLWNVVNNWMDELDETTFTELLPLLRRSFAHFSQPERRKLGEKSRTGGSGTILPAMVTELDEARSQQGITVVMRLMGYGSSE